MLPPDPLPEVVQVTCPDGTVRTVYPKDEATLREVMAFDALLGRYLPAWCEAATHASAAVRAASARTGEPLQSTPARVLAWIFAHPGPGLPYDAEGDAETARAAIPAWTATLAARDMLALLGAFMRVNAAAIARLAGRADATPELALSAIALRAYEVLP